MTDNLLTAKQAAMYLGVSKRYFDEHVRRHLPFADLRAPGARKPMPRWARADLDVFIASRRIERIAS